MIYRHAAAHLGLALLLFTLWGASDAWSLVTGWGLAGAISALLGAITGFLLTGITHEWAHFAGARLASATISIPASLGPFVYEYDFDHNSLRQFNIMSLAGQAGSWISVLVLWSLLPLDTPGRAMLVAGAVASAVFAGLVELPVLRRSQRSGNPLAELSKIDARVLLGSAAGGLTAGALVFWQM